MMKTVKCRECKELFVYDHVGGKERVTCGDECRTKRRQATRSKAQARKPVTKKLTVTKPKRRVAPRELEVMFVAERVVKKGGKLPPACELSLEFRQDGNFTIAVLEATFKGERVTSIGVAKRNPRDRFVPIVGRNIAMCRAADSLAAKLA